MSAEHIADTFRRWGYLHANLDSLNRLEPFNHPDIVALDGKKEAEKWRTTYCSTVGAEFMHMPFPDRIGWVAERMEGPQPKVDQAFILQRLVHAETFEDFIHTRYVGSKRFSIEGLASLIPLLDSILCQAADNGFEYLTLAMPHRGRLTVMTMIACARPALIFAGFEDVDPKSVLGSGDVKYHKGATGIYKSQKGNELRVHLGSNPSHLEAVNPVIMGRTRAKQDRIGDKDRKKVLSVVIHGDAAFAGQGVSAETLNYATVDGFTIGGTIHIIANNLMGFTAVPKALHSSRFASDIAKRLPIPIFHVNGDDPDAAARIGQIAVDYRRTFSSDVVIDLIGFRRYGHSEVDDPTLTSPLLYAMIAEKPLHFDAYAQSKSIPSEKVKELENSVTEFLAGELEEGRKATKQPVLATLPNYWEKYHGGPWEPAVEVETAVSAEELAEVGKVIRSAPKGFTIHPKLDKYLEQRLEMSLGKRAIDYGTAEALAFGSLLRQGTPVRLAGQDCRRGTFSHRHSTLYDYKTGEAYVPLQHLSAKQAAFNVYDSVLSEAAAVGFEYGYSRDYPETLVCWEAQFGDFANGAQIIIDQFISAGEDKWGLLSGLVMLLPHGYEGQGPEHSSARIERYLQLAGEDNMQICQPSTAGQYFHLLRRQALQSWRKPLIVFTPKSMLRAAAACSQLSDLTQGKFQNLMPDSAVTDATRILLCSGKIAHELTAERQKRKDTTTAILRLEQMYPFPEEELQAELARYPNASTIIWVQEEPANMGPLFFVRPIIERLAGGRKVTTVRRSASGSPATGSAAAHALEQQALLKLAFATYA